MLLIVILCLPDVFPNLVTPALFSSFIHLFDSLFLDFCSTLLPLINLTGDFFVFRT